MTDLEQCLGATIEIAETPPDEQVEQEYEQDMWLDRDKLILNESTFAKAFRDKNGLTYNNGLFYSYEGKVTEEIITKHVWVSLDEMGIGRDVARLTHKLVEAIKICSTVDKLRVDPNIIPFPEGNFYIKEWAYRIADFTPVPFRLSASLCTDNIPKTPYFDKWLRDLFYKEDIPTIQEYLGYCLVPTTRAQKALFLLGEGGAGKSGLGVILQAILGDAIINIANTQEFLQDKFKLPELEHKLVLYDDDLDSQALSETGLYKKLITNTLAITADRKYGQPFKFTPQIKLVACCNKMLSSIYDNTSGFYRRLLPVIVKPISRDFVPDKDFYEHLKQEADGIVPWIMQGLCRLIENNWVLSESKRTKDYMQLKQSIDNPLPQFMETVFDFDPTSPGIPTTEIMQVYEVWCRKNNYTPQKSRSVQLWLADNGERYNISASQNITISDGKRVRGYKGLTIRKEWKSDGRIMLN